MYQSIRISQNHFRYVIFYSKIFGIPHTYALSHSENSEFYHLQCACLPRFILLDHECLHTVPLCLQQTILEIVIYLNHELKFLV